MNNFYLFQGFSTSDLTPMEAAKVLAHCEHRLGYLISEEDLHVGNLKKWLSSDDYNFTMDKVSKSLQSQLPLWRTLSVRRISPISGHLADATEDYVDLFLLPIVVDRDKVTKQRGYFKSFGDTVCRS